MRRNYNRLHAGELTGMRLVQGNGGEIQSHDDRKRQGLPAELAYLQTAISMYLHVIKSLLRVIIITSNPMPSLTWVKLVSRL